MEFAVATFKCCRSLPRTDETRDITRQLRRCGSSVAANCRALRRSQSDKAFVAKAGMVIEEADEAGFWLDFIVEVGIVSRAHLRPLLQEADELVAIFTASRKTVQARMEKEREVGRAARSRRKPQAPDL